MRILHGTWIPSDKKNYIQNGSFYLWGERALLKNKISLEKEGLIDFLRTDFGIKGEFNGQIKNRYFILPAKDKMPLNSYDFFKYSEKEIPAEFDFQEWRISCYEVKTREILKILNDIYFISLYSTEEIRLGRDILFWYHYINSLKEIILKDSYRRN